MADKILVDKAFYEDLLKRDIILSALESGGVDNWEGYSEALNNIDETEEEIYG